MTTALIRIVEDIFDIDPTSISPLRSIFVTEFGPKTTAEGFFIHFQRARNGGGDIDSIIISKRGTAVVTFDSPQVVASVLQHMQELEGNVLTVQPFSDTLHTNFKNLTEVNLEASDKYKDKVTRSHSFECHPQIVNLLARTYKTNLQDIEEEFGVRILWDENKSAVRIFQKIALQGQKRFQEGCDAFIDLFQKLHTKVSREVVDLPHWVNEFEILDAISFAQAENPMIIAKVKNSLEVYAEKDNISTSVHALKKNLGLTNDGGNRKTGRGQQNSSRDVIEKNEAQHWGRLNQHLANGVRLSLYQGDITDERVDAIVNAANERLQHGAGVAGAIVRKGGRQIQDESNRITSRHGPVNVGKAVYTSGGVLPCNYVIHAVGPKWNDHGREEYISLLRQACLESLHVAAALELSSIAFSAISSGIFGMPKNICAQVMFEAMEKFSASDVVNFSTVRDVRIVIIDEPTLNIFYEEFIKRYPFKAASPTILKKQTHSSDESTGEEHSSNLGARRKDRGTKSIPVEEGSTDFTEQERMQSGRRSLADEVPLSNMKERDSKDEGKRTEDQLQRTLAQERQARSRVEEEIRQARISHAEVEERLQAELLLNKSLQTNLATRESMIREQQRSLEEEQQQKATLQERLRSLEEQMEEERRRHLSTERELQSRILAEEQASAEYPSRQSCDWIIQRAEVVLSDKILGRGAWGEVRKGTFRACQVAVKEMHELILSEYNRGLFEREMNMAARCRHPNLLQFIGATNEDGSPLFVTELLDTSLRHILHQRSLSQEEIVVLALDIAKALNYLHLNKPRPIIHRDISSGNVLLWKRGDSWRAKLSDYGAANFMRETMTMNPGAAIYSAPEALTPQQTSKVDVYSLGVLLCEMCIRQQPDPQELHNQIGRVGAAFRGLIQRCVERNPEARPTMGEIISELEKLL